MTGAIILKWIMPTPGEWKLVPHVRTAKGDRPASDIEMGKKAR
jgi:hypothetical protein